MRITLVIILTMMMIVLPVYTANAIQTEVVPVDPAPYYDDSPHVWGNYIVWRRAINVDDDTIIDFGTEPSWIMVHNLVSDETWNITPANVLNSYAKYEWAESPSIWNGKVVYEYVWGNEAYKSGVYMYNISQNETWKVPIPTTYQGGHYTEIYGDFILATHYGTSQRQGFLYNYETKEFKTLVTTTSGLTIGDVSFTDNFITYTTYNPGTLVYTINIFNISSYQIATLDASVFGINHLLSSDMYNNYIVCQILEISPTSSWNLFIYDITQINWLSFGATTTYQWASIYENLTAIDRDFTSDAVNGNIWANWIVYTDFTGAVGSSPSNIRLVNIESDRSINMTYNVYFQDTPDIYMDKIVWRDNRNSDTNYGNARDIFDIYRSQTDIESMTTSMYIILPLFAVAMIIGAVAIAIRQSFGGF